MDDTDKDFEDEYVIIVVDSTGIKVTNRNHLMQDKWGLGKKGYLKIHVIVNIKPKEILALEVTDEKLHDGKIMEQLVVEHALENKNINIKSVLFDDDGAYGSNGNFKYLQKNKIRPAIKIRKNSIISSKKKRQDKK